MSAENFGIKEAAKKLNMGVPTLRKLVKDRKIGEHNSYSIEEIEEYGKYINLINSIHNNK